MTPSSFERALRDLGWIALSQRALGLRPAEAYALYQMVRAADCVVSLGALAAGYTKDHVAGTSDNGIRKRVERARAALTDVGCDGVIRTLVGEKAYTIRARDVPRIEEAMLAACGFSLTHGRAA